MIIGIVTLTIYLFPWTGQGQGRMPLNHVLVSQIYKPYLIKFQLELSKQIFFQPYN